MKRVRLMVALALLAGILTVVLAVDLPSVGASLGLTGPDSNSPQALLDHALQQANEAGSFEVAISLDQTVRQVHPLRFNAPQETAHFEIEGALAKPDRARLSILPGRTSFALSKTEAQEFLTVDGQVYHRSGERWVETESDVPATEVNGLGLSLLSVARDVVQLDPAAGPPALGELAPTFRRVSFKLYPDDVRDYLLRQQGIYDAQAVQMARLSAPVIEGSGELWLNDAGYPARLVLYLEWVEWGEEPYRVLVSSTTDYGRFGRQYSDDYFDPSTSTQTGGPLPRSMNEQWPQFGLWMVTALGVLLLAWLLFYASKRWRWAAILITVTLVITLLTPTLAPVAEAAGGVAQPDAGQTERPPIAGSEVAQMLDESRQLQARHAATGSSPAGSLDDEGDLDGDKLPNGYELRLGTSPFAADSDYDGLTDYDEVIGTECEWKPGFTSYIQTNPLDPDSNDDGLPDGKEFYRGDCGGNKYGYLWADDNDMDGVLDGIDLSPFSKSGPGNYGGSKAGPNLTFETLDQDPGPGTTLYPFYVELQIRPTMEESLRWAYKSLFWPADDLGAIQNWGNLSAYLLGQPQAEVPDGKITLVPFLQAIVSAYELPSQEARDHYGVGVSELEDENGDLSVDPFTLAPLYEMTIPLTPVERGGQVYAFMAKMLHDQNGNPALTRQWKNVRLKWAIIADVLMANGEGDLVPNPAGGYGLIIYDEPYILTGLQVSRQGGASTLLAAALPTQGRRYDDGPIAQLRAGMEAQFLPGALSMADVKERFDKDTVDPNIDLELRWGIPLEREYRVMYDPATMTYEHLDEAIATTMMTTTLQMLEENFAGFESLNPSMILASEQRTSSVNLDDDPPANYGEFTINTCLHPMMTSRSLKLQTYQWEMEGLEGTWRSLSLDEVLEKIEAEYKATVPWNSEFFDEELNILKLAATSWHIGQTAIYKIATVTVNALEHIPKDPELIFKLLDENGLLPEYFLEVVEALLDVWENGGPLVWFEEQWNKVMSAVDEFGETIKGSFLDFSPSVSPPSDAVGEGGGDGGGPAPPSEPEEPWDEKIMGWTEGAITVLTVLASITGSEFFSDVAEVLTKIVEIYKVVRKVCDIIKATIDVLKSATPIQTALDYLSRELGSLSQQMSLLGLIIAVFMVWAGLMMTLGISDYGPLMTASLVMQAIIQTVILVALFVLATLFPWGTVLAVVIGLIKMLGDVIGVPLDPLSLIVDLFTPDTEQLTDFAGADFTDFSIVPLDPGGGMIQNRAFRVELVGDIYLGTYDSTEGPDNRVISSGGPADLNESSAQLHVEPDLEAPPMVWNSAYWGRDKWADPVVGYSPFLASNGAYHRKFHNRAGVDLRPYDYGVNSKVPLYAQLELTLRMEDCSVAGALCEKYDHDTWSGRSFLPGMVFDILPLDLEDVWHWDDLYNTDPDGDGLRGFVHPTTLELVGPDADLCPGSYLPSRDDWDTDNDGLSDRFEVENEGFDPCKEDTDGDEVPDQRELFRGTRPDLRDTDGDGLTDHEEEVYEGPWGRVWPWTIDMEGKYPGLPDPPAFPNPRHANLDGDYRRDDKERDERSSPNALNPPPIGEPLELWITQECAEDQGTEISITSSPWSNPVLAATNGELEITLPVAFSNRTASAGLRPLVLDCTACNDAVMDLNTATTQRWSLPMIFQQGRYVDATLSGVPDTPTQPVSVTARLEYDEGGVTQVTTETVPLRVNIGGPTTRLVDVLGASVLGREGFPRQAASSTAFDGTAVPEAHGSVLIAADAGDPDWLKALFVCVKTTGDKCNTSDWQPASLIPHTPFWLYEFVPPADGIYTVRAYAVDTCGTSGSPSAAWTLGVDQTPPTEVRFDEDDALYLSSTAIENQPTIQLSGWAADAAHAPYVSGVDWVGLLVDMAPLGITNVDQPGEISSTFAYSWTLPESHYGPTLYGFTPAYDLLVGIADVAGNISPISDSLRVVVDDTPPLVYADPAQTLDGDTITLSGLADDTALLYDRGPAQPYEAAQTAADYDAAFHSGVDMGTALVAGDLNGDQIDDVVLLIPAASDVPGGDTPFSAGLFLGRPEGHSGVLELTDADVVLNGELPLAPRLNYPPTAAAAGDVNGDGLDDLLLGDPSTDTGAGKAYLVLGRRDWPATLDLSAADWELSAAGSNGFGNAVGAAGDVNGDGLSDFLVGAYSHGVVTGVVWLYLGREQGAAPAHTTFHPPGIATSPPANLAGLGDTNGDGLSDFMIAFAGPVEVPTPAALVYGRPDDAWPVDPVDLNSDADALFLGPGAQQTVSPAGDLNGDGLRDLLVGDPGASEPRVYILFGRRPEDAWAPAPDRHLLSSVADASFVDPGTPASRLGASLTTLGDVDGDHRDDFAFGQPGSGTTQTRVAIVLSEKRTLSPDMPIEMATHLISGTAPGYYFGSLLSAGDANGDHVPDILVGAAGEYRSYLFYGGYETGSVSGIAQVELGFFGPVADPTLPFTATMPAAWQTATLSHPNQPISAWRGELTFPSPEGDYRLYARPQDQVGNVPDTETWYLGNVWANSDPLPITSGDLTMNTPLLLEQTNLTLSGIVKTILPPQHWRVYNGYEWQRLQPKTGAWSSESVLPRYDERLLTFRAVARDAFGNTLHDSTTLIVDNRVAELPTPVGNLPLNVWHTDISPTLTITWPPVSDANDIVGAWAAIDTAEQTSPVTSVSSNEVTRVLDAPGIYYGHVRLQDGVGNEALAHAGPYLVNRTRTPSLIQPDGRLSASVGEYPDSTLFGYDPIAVEKPAALWGTWDADALYLGYPGYDWGPDKLLAVYLDTTAGGVTGTVTLISNTHTLPFAADYAFIASDGGTLYSAASGDWVAQGSPLSYAVTLLDTEIVLDRSEIQATGAVSMLAYIEDDQGIQAVLPADARPEGNRVLVGPTEFVDNFYWPSLADGVLPNEGLGQVISPTINIQRPTDYVVNSGQTTSVMVEINNPDIKAYGMETLVVEADQDLVWTGVDGATCLECPDESGRWTLGVDVGAGTMHSVTLEAEVRGHAEVGVVPINVMASMPGGGLSSTSKVPTGRARFDLDRGTSEVEFAKKDTTIYKKPGATSIPFVPGGDNVFERCGGHVESNVDESGWLAVCNVGDCYAVEMGLPDLSSRHVELRVVGENGCSSDPIGQIVVADGVSPTVQIGPAEAISGTLAFVRGVAWDEFPTSRTPERVEVSIDGGRFHPAYLSAELVQQEYARQTEPISMTNWLFPLHLTTQDGVSVTLSARAVDEAGNVGPASDPITITLDNIGPTVTVSQTDSLLEGTIHDGSGVDSFEISLDGGMHYEPVSWAGEDWAFDMGSWSGSALQPFAMLHAVDVWGNHTRTWFPIDFELQRVYVYLPLIMRSSPGREATTPAVDDMGPTVTVTQTGSLLNGTIHDASGVDSFEISLDGGLQCEAVAWEDEHWTFDMAAWSGSSPRSSALLHAVDVWGNDSHLEFPIDLALEGVSLYLPLVVRNKGGP